MAVFYTGKTIRGVVRVLNVDPVTGNKTADPANNNVTIRFRRESGTVLVERTVANGGVVNDGNGYYHADAVPDQAGLYTIEYETGGAVQGRDKDEVQVDQF